MAEEIDTTDQADDIRMILSVMRKRDWVSFTQTDAGYAINHEDGTQSIVLFSREGSA